MRISTYGKLVLFRQLVHTQDSNDILERLVILEDLLDGGGDLVVLLANLFTMACQRLELTQDRPELTIRGSSMRDLESRGSTAG